MRKTENFGLNLLDYSDQLSPKPLNENAAKLDALLKTVDATLTGHGESLTEQGESLSGHADTLDSLTTAVGLRVRMACGSYDGDGELTRSISTPGFTPAALLIRKREAIAGSLNIESFHPTFTDRSFSAGGFVLWNGNDISVVYWHENGDRRDYETGVVSPIYKNREAEVQFTASPGSLTWKLKTDSDKPPAEGVGNDHCVNNQTGVTYDWVAFGREEEINEGEKPGKEES